MCIYSTPEELVRIKKTLFNYMRLPFFSNNIPGAIMESSIGHVRSAAVLNTYDFVDVWKADQQTGWQVKSTRSTTPVTWKRAKIASATELIENSYKSPADLQNLGDAIINLCNDHAHESYNLYKLRRLGYCRLIIHRDNSITYFERELSDSSNPNIFEPSEFRWKWSTPKKTKRKEQLPALHGFHRATGQKWWAWHGLGENQLHFSGEKQWWPERGDEHRIDFKLPTGDQKITILQFTKIISDLD